MQQSFFWGTIMYLLSFIGCGDDYYNSTPPYIGDTYIEEPYIDEYVEETPNVNYEDVYAESLTLWEQEKKAHNNSYDYTLEYSAFEANSYYTTKCTVKNGVVVERTNESYSYKNDKKVIGKTWTETKDKVGKNKDGFPAKTLDEIYSDCGSIYIKGSGPNDQIMLETAFDGIISLCGYWPESCQDDCFVGVSFISFNWLN